jgi:hypothetical protein
MGKLKRDEIRLEALEVLRAHWVAIVATDQERAYGTTRRANNYCCISVALSEKTLLPIIPALNHMLRITDQPKPRLSRHDSDTSFFAGRHGNQFLL